MSAADNNTCEMLMQLSHDLGREDRRLAILGEGNTSARLSIETFLVKASGSSLGTLKEQDLVECRFEPLLDLLDDQSANDESVGKALLASRVDQTSKRPSVEAMAHAFLLAQEGVNVVGHTHPIAVNQILCSPRAADFATKRTFPDEIVCCGVRSVLVPYVDPGLTLARTIRDGWNRHMSEFGQLPRIVLLQNHGLFAPAANAAGVMAATLMAVKAAEIFVGAAALGGPVFLPEGQVSRIESRPDEHHRRKALNL